MDDDDPEKDIFDAWAHEVSHLAPLLLVMLSFGAIGGLLGYLLVSSTHITRPEVALVVGATTLGGSAIGSVVMSLLVLWSERRTFQHSKD